MIGPGLDKQLETIFHSFKDLDALIIDIRFNMGGDDKFSQLVAARLVKEETIGFYKQTRVEGEFQELKSKFIPSKGKSRFFGPTLLLTNDRSVSAADVLALMMAELPNVTIVGERSNGSYSDLYTKKLPNGWQVSLSNQRYLSAQKVNYEGVGTPVDIEVKNMLQDFENNNDTVLIAALEHLKEMGYARDK